MENNTVVVSVVDHEWEVKTNNVWSSFEDVTSL